MDETLCDTQGANTKALHLFREELLSLGVLENVDLFLNDYLLAIYRDTSEAYKVLTAGIKDELEYRRFSFSYLLNNLGVEKTDQYLELVERFEKLRMELGISLEEFARNFVRISLVFRIFFCVHRILEILAVSMKFS